MTIQGGEQRQRTFVSFGLAGLVALIAGGLCFVFVVNPVWSTSAQMQAERLEEQRATEPVEPRLPRGERTWEEEVALFLDDYVPELIVQDLAPYDGVAAEDFFQLKRGQISLFDERERQVGTAELFYIPNRTFFVRLTDLNLPAGPGYLVGLSHLPAPNTGDEISQAPFMTLSTLHHFSGSRNILIDPRRLQNRDMLPTRFESLVIWNAKFNRIIATARLQ